MREYPLPAGVIPEGRGGGGYFPKLPKRVSAAQQGREFGTRSVVLRLNLYSVAGRLGKTLKYRDSDMDP